MKRLVIFLLVALIPLMAVPQDPISRPGKKKQNTTQTTNTSQKRKQQEAEKRRKAEQARKAKEERERKEREEQERKAKEERERKEREEQERIAREEQARREREEQERLAREEQARREREEQERKTYNGYEWVDLGLSVKWATKNVGASSPSDYGNYYAWGETTTKSDYSSSTSKTYGKSMGNIGGNSSYDVARYRWGGNWRLPTKAELEELITKCTWTWTTQGGHKGYKVTGKNGNSIFLPAAGWRYGKSPSFVGEYGRYWSSTPNDSYTNFAYDLYFGSSYHYVDWNLRYCGYSVRPVVE